MTAKEKDPMAQINVPKKTFILKVTLKIWITASISIYHLVVKFCPPINFIYKNFLRLRDSFETSVALSGWQTWKATK